MALGDKKTVVMVEKTGEYNADRTLSNLKDKKQALANLGAAAEVHGHTTSQITGLDTALSNKADLVNGQVPYSQTHHLTASKNLYVDGTLGNDTNPGTQQAPFRTIQAAIDSLPKDLGESGVTINIAEGEYLEDVVIGGFRGGRFNSSLVLKGSSAADTTRHINTLYVFNTTCPITVEGLYASENANGFSVAFVEAFCIVRNLYVKKSPESTAVIGVVVGEWGASQVSFIGGQVDGYSKVGVSVNQNSVVTIRGVKISNCGVGIKSGDANTASGGIAMETSVTYEGNTSNTKKEAGGQIFT